MTTPESVTGNPYVGPRTFERPQGHLFFGREQEARDLLARVVSERLLLFYAQSGAGKSSLINTRLIPGLQEEGFTVLPVGRVSGDLSQGATQISNVFLHNLLRSLNQGSRDVTLPADITLSHFLARLSSEDGERWEYVPVASGAPGPAVVEDTVSATGSADASVQPFVLIIDQFEEIITAHPGRWQEREGFFRQLNQALLDDPNLWVVLTLREDYVASLDPYAELMFNRLRGRFYMERMGVAAALDAVRKPAELAGRPFAPGVAEKLVDDLRQVRVAGQTTTIPGQYVEPVQLQVVCYQLWERLQAHPLPGERMATEGAITFEDLAQAGNVDCALGQFYEDTLAAVLADPGAAAALDEQYRQACRTSEGRIDLVPAGPKDADAMARRLENLRERVERLQTRILAPPPAARERQLRTWFDEQLITEAGTRGLVHQGEGDAGGLPNIVVKALQKRFLVRAEARGGDIWIELAHDRFVDPIRASNRAWFARNVSPLSQDAKAWDAAGRPIFKLYGSSRLAAARVELETRPEEFGDVERAFLEAGRRRETQVRIGCLSLVMIVFLALTVWALISRGVAQRAQNTAEIEAISAMMTGVAARATGFAAQEAEATARVEKVTAEWNAALASTRAAEARSAQELAQANAGTASAERALAQARGTELAGSVGTQEANLVTAIAAEANQARAASTQVAAALATQEALYVAQLTALALPQATTPPPSRVSPGPSPSATPAVRPPTRTPTPTATPNPVVVAQQTQLAQVRLTQTALAAPTIPPPQGRIVYTSNRGNPSVSLELGSELWSITLALGDRTQLTFSRGAEATYSRTRDMIAFTARTDSGKVQLWEMSAKGGAPSPIDEVFWDNWEASYSPDGRRVVFTSSRDNQDWEIWTMDVGRGSNPRQLTNDDPALNWSPSGSPDGKYIAYFSTRLVPIGRVEVWRMDADGGNKTPLTSGNWLEKAADPIRSIRGRDWQLSWSPDSRQIAFPSNRDGNREVYLMDRDGKNQRNLTKSVGSDEDDPAWSLDGNWIALVRSTLNGQMLVLKSIDNRQEVQLTSGGHIDRHPVWLP